MEEMNLTPMSKNGQQGQECDIHGVMLQTCVASEGKA
jgi:hypothetical protein